MSNLALPYYDKFAPADRRIAVRAGDRKVAAFATVDEAVDFIAEWNAETDRINQA